MTVGSKQSYDFLTNTHALAGTTKHER